jgi:transcriptional regulator with XRE-family HTH domain
MKKTRREKSVPTENGDPSSQQSPFQRRVSQTILNLRKALNMRQDDPGFQKEGIFANYISDYESGKRSPSLESIEKLASAFNLSPDLFFILVADPNLARDSSIQDLISSLQVRIDQLVRESTRWFLGRIQKRLEGDIYLVHFNDGDFALVERHQIRRPESVEKITEGERVFVLMGGVTYFQADVVSVDHEKGTALVELHHPMDPFFTSRGSRRETKKLDELGRIFPPTQEPPGPREHFDEDEQVWALYPESTGRVIPARLRRVRPR